MTLDELKSQLTFDTYTPKTEEQMQSEAEKQYASTYNQKKLAAQQTYDQSDLALSNQLASLDQSYQKQREAAEKSTRASQSSLDRYSLQRGMQRSSYNVASQANLLAEGEKNLNEINQSETTARQSLESQRTQLASQLAAQLGQYDVDYANDVQAYFNQLKSADEEAKVTADKYRNQLLMALYEYDPKGSSGGSSSSSTKNYYNGGNLTGDDLNADGSSNDTLHHASVQPSAYQQLLAAFRRGATRTLTDENNKTKMTTEDNNIQNVMKKATTQHSYVNNSRFTSAAKK